MPSNTQGGPAVPVTETNQAPVGGPAQPAYIIQAGDGYQVAGGPSQLVKVISDPNYPRVGGPAIPVSIVSSGARQAAGGPAMPVYYINPPNSIFAGGALTHSVQLADVPGILDQHGFEELGGILYAVGGETTVAASNTLYAFDPVAGTWSTKHALPALVQSPIVRAVGGKLYCIGGLNDSLAVTKKCYQYDPTNDGAGWVAKTDMPTAREDMGSAVIGTKIYVFGGLTTTNTPTKKLEIYDTVSDTWDITKADMPDYKHFGDFGAAFNGIIYAISGSNTFPGYPNLFPVKTCYKYDPATNVWSTIAPIPVATCYKEIVVLNGIIYTVSGCTSSTTTLTNIIQAYDPVRDQWASGGMTSPFGAQGIGLCTYNGDIYMSGGAWYGAQKNFYKLSTSPLGPELVVNGSMETGDPPTGWINIAWATSTRSAAADEHTRGTGTKSLDVLIASGSGSGGSVNALPVATLTGHTYFFEIWNKNIDNTSSTLQIYDAAFGSTPVNTANLEVGNWVCKQSTFTSPTDGVNVLFLANGAINKHARYDGISIKEVL